MAVAALLVTDEETRVPCRHARSHRRSLPVAPCLALAIGFVMQVLALAGTRSTASRCGLTGQGLVDAVMLVARVRRWHGAVAVATLLFSWQASTQTCWEVRMAVSQRTALGMQQLAAVACIVALGV